MNKISLMLETITPLFLSGNDQNTVELRAASIRGQLRYWYRSLLGGLGLMQPGRLHDFESQVFGKEEQGSQVLLRIKQINFANGRIKQNSELGLGSHRPGLTYLLYSTQLGGNRRPYADVGTTFTIELSCFDKEAPKWLKLAACALWCWCQFGGLGTRARRGGGNIRVKGITDSDNLLDRLPDFTLGGVKDIAALKEHLEKGLKNVCNCVAQLNSLTAKISGGIIDFPVLHPNYTDIWIIKETWDDVFSAMEQVGKKFQQFRFKRNPDFPSLLEDYLRKGSQPNLERPVFGLPLQFRYRSAPDKQAMVEAENFSRRASPLLLRFLRLGNGKISLVLVWSKSSFLPAGKQLKIKDQSRGQRQKPQSINPPIMATQQRLIHEFRGEFAGYLDVRGWL